MVVLLLAALLPMAQFDNELPGYPTELWMLDPRIISESELDAALAEVVNTTVHARTSVFDSVGTSGEVYLDFTVNGSSFVFRSGHTLYGNITVPTPVNTPVVPTPVPTRIIQAEGVPMAGTVNIKAVSNMIVTKNGNDIELAALTGGTPIAQPTIVLVGTPPVVVSGISGGYEIYVQTPTNSPTPTNTSVPLTPVPPTPQEISANGGTLYKGKPFDVTGSGSVIVSVTDVGPRIEININSSTGGTPAPTPDKGVYNRAGDLTEIKNGTFRFLSGTGMSVDFPSTVNGSTGDYHVTFHVNTPTATQTPTATVPTSTPTKIAIRDLRDVNPAMTPVTNEVLTWDGSDWTSAGIIHPTPVPTRVLNAGNGINLSDLVTSVTIAVQTPTVTPTWNGVLAAPDGLRVWIDTAEPPDGMTDSIGWALIEEDTEVYPESTPNDADRVIDDVHLGSEVRRRFFTPFALYSHSRAGGGITEAEQLTYSDNNRLMWTDLDRYVHFRGPLFDVQDDAGQTVFEQSSSDLVVYTDEGWEYFRFDSSEKAVIIPEQVDGWEAIPPAGSVALYVVNAGSSPPDVRISNATGTWKIDLTSVP